MRKRITTDAFTMLEVLLATAVLSIALFYLIQGYNHLQVAYSHLGKHAQAAYLAQQKLFEMHYTETQKRKVVGREDLFQYTLQQRPLDRKPYRAVDILLEWSDLRASQELSLATVIHHESE